MILTTTLALSTVSPAEVVAAMASRSFSAATSRVPSTEPFTAASASCKIVLTFAVLENCAVAARDWSAVFTHADSTASSQTPLEHVRVAIPVRPLPQSCC